MDPEVLEWITTRRAELDGLEEQLAKQLEEVRAERDELQRTGSAVQIIWQGGFGVLRSLSPVPLLRSGP